MIVLEARLMIRIETPRLILRDMTMEDSADLFGIFSDPQAMRFYPSSKNKEETDAWIRGNIERYKRFGFGIWVVLLKDTQIFAGQCGLIVQDVEGKQEVEIGYMFLRKYWGKGLATEAASACRDYAFRKLNCPRVISLIDPGNLASIRVAEKVGMRFDKEIQKWNKRVHVYSLLNSEDESH